MLQQMKYIHNSSIPKLQVAIFKQFQALQD